MRLGLQQVVTNIDELEIDIASQLENLEGLKKRINKLKSENTLTDPEIKMALSDLEAEVKLLEGDIVKKSKLLDKISKSKTKAEQELNSIVKNPDARFSEFFQMLKNISDEILPIAEMDKSITSKQSSGDKKYKELVEQIKTTQERISLNSELQVLAEYLGEEMQNLEDIVTTCPE